MLNQIDFSKIPVFLTAAECLNFTETADKHFMSQSSLSKAIAAFESDIGFPLFVRGNRRVSLTPEGEYLYKELSDIMNRVSNVIDTAKQIRSGQAGSLCIGTSGYLAKTPAFEKICFHFSMIYPYYEIELRHMAYTDLRKSLVDGKVDAILYNQHDLAVLHGIHKLPLAQGSPVLLCNPKLIDTDNKDSLSINDFRNHKFVCLDKNQIRSYYEYLVDCCRAHGFTPNITRYSSSIMETINYVNSTNYVTILDASLIPEAVSEYGMIPIEPIDGFENLETVLAWKTDNANPVLRNYIDLAEEISCEKASFI